jgi:hypothetical protein
VSPLILKRASDSRSSGEWSDDDYDVLADRVVVDRVMKAAAKPADAGRRCDETLFRPAASKLIAPNNRFEPCRRLRRRILSTSGKKSPRSKGLHLRRSHSLPRRWLYRSIASFPSTRHLSSDRAISRPRASPASQPPYRRCSSRSGGLTVRDTLAPTGNDPEFHSWISVKLALSFSQARGRPASRRIASPSRCLLRATSPGDGDDGVPCPASPHARTTSASMRRIA